MNERFTSFKDESGVTLIELLAALAILSLIITAFLAFFIQSSRTSSQASDVNEATFIAQQEMEEMVYYSNSSEVTLPEDYSLSGDENRQTVEGYEVITTINKAEEAILYSVLVKVREGNVLRAQMENRLSFDEEE